ncbi:DUF2225 domain-containing protein [Candidatus Venteria ishoeyi]|uniref:Tetratricopeptide repeat protein n=1 Tax=Candidatus Venteria ishoeyi TaxID=1899563 RepID=A0A1H6FFZ9_9GAMM|nr:DUF2225 domain-containing protein [Candidatus Venteria ishoeyi]SEH08573.1 Uncharacterised protein [Candidatus Venteria ishoeyi]
MIKLIFTILMSLPLAVCATTWGSSEVVDPIFEDKKCSVHKPSSWGSYIYRWPSKYDQVFWPITEKYGIWHCKESGFTAFIGDFENISPIEVERIKAYLKANPPKNSDIETKLVLLEQIYALREKDSTFKNKLIRTLARWYQEIGNIDKANAYRKTALIDIEKQLSKSLPEIQRLEYLYLAMNYSMQAGDQKKGGEYREKLESALSSVTDTDKNTKGYSEYLKELMPASKFITSGGTIDPELP